MKDRGRGLGRNDLGYGSQQGSAPHYNTLRNALKQPNCAFHELALLVRLGLHLSACACSGVRHRGVPAANLMQNVSAFMQRIMIRCIAILPKHHICSEDILENEKIIRLAPNGPNSAERRSVYLRILNASKLAPLGASPTAGGAEGK